MAAPARTGVCALAAVALLAGCGHGGKRGTTTTTEATTVAASGNVVDGIHVLAVIDVHETEYRLKPAAIGFERIGYFGIRAVNEGKALHALAVKGPGVHAQTRTLGPGRSDAIAVFFRKPGVYRIYCPLDRHAQRGMRGIIRVR